MAVSGSYWFGVWRRGSSDPAVVHEWESLCKTLGVGVAPHAGPRSSAQTADPLVNPGATFERGSAPPGRASNDGGLWRQHLAVVAAAIAAVVIGVVYYGILGMGARQSRMLGATPPQPGPVQLATGVIVGLVNAWVIAVIALNLGASSVADAVLLGVLLWLGFGATLKAAQVAFERRPWGFWLIQGVHDLVVTVVIAAIVTVWR